MFRYLAARRVLACVFALATFTSSRAHAGLVDQFPITLKQTVSDGVPGPGAGNIEATGASRRLNLRIENDLKPSPSPSLSPVAVRMTLLISSHAKGEGFSHNKITLLSIQKPLHARLTLHTLILKITSNSENQPCSTRLALHWKEP